MADDPMGATTTEEAPATTDDLLRQIAQAQEDQRNEVAALRAQIDAQRPSAPTGLSGTVKSQEELLAERYDQLSSHSHYCPGCGKLVDYQQQCTGTATAPHQPIEVVSTDEVGHESDPANHTPAPPSENLG